MRDIPAIESFVERRSIKQFAPEQISREDLDWLVKAMVNSPTAKNLQRFHFTVIQDRALLDRVTGMIKAYMLEKGGDEQRKRAERPEYDPLYGAPTLIVVSGELDASFYVQTDCGIAVGSIVAAADMLGLGTCVIGSSLFMFQGDNAQALRAELGIPEHYRAVCSVAVGTPRGDRPENPGKKTDLVTYL